MRYEVLVSADVSLKINEFRQYIAYTYADPIAAERVFDDIVSKIESLTFMPRRVRVKKDVYKVHVRHCIIYYRVIGDKVFVFKIVHGKQNFRI